MVSVAGAPGKALRVALISKVTLNPYVCLLAQGLERAGVQCRMERTFGLPLRGKQWGGCDPELLNKHRTDILHFHWLELLYLYPSWKDRLRRTLSVMSGMWLAKRRGIRVVCTVHNLMAHEDRYANWNDWVNRYAFGTADGIHVHDVQMQEAIESRYGCMQRMHVIPHGNYIGAYPDACTRDEARTRLDLGSDARVLLFMGQVRPYKGIEELIEAFKMVARKDEVLLIAGRPTSAGYRAVIEELALGCEGIRLSLDYVPPEEVQYFMRAASACVLAYRHVSTSGAAMLAFSFGTPVVAPALGSFSEVVGGERGILYDPLQKDGLAQALIQARFVDWSRAGEAALAYARELDWDRIAARHLGVYCG